MFRDRADAGEQLADLLGKEGIEADVILGIPRGALPVARPVADAYGVPLDVVVASKIGAPDNPELAIGAVASDGSRWLNDELIERLNVPGAYVEREGNREAEQARRKAERYRAGRGPLELAGKRAVVVDDGIATGATARACLRQLRGADAAHVVLAVPVGPPDAIESLRAEADVIVAVETPPHFRAVGQFYEVFEQVSDEAAMAYLDER